MMRDDRSAPPPHVYGQSATSMPPQHHQHMAANVDNPHAPGRGQNFEHPSLDSSTIELLASLSEAGTNQLLKSTLPEKMEGNLEKVAEHEPRTEWTEGLYTGVDHAQFPAAVEEVMLTTDSGYASGPNAKCCLNVESSNDLVLSFGRDVNSRGSEVDKIDSRTEYSVATTISPVQTHTYMNEICQDIYSKVRDRMDVQDWPVLSKSLPDLVKAFSVKVGFDNSAQINRDVMYFVYKHHG
jgi:hypothetical protein